MHIAHFYLLAIMLFEYWVCACVSLLIAYWCSQCGNSFYYQNLTFSQLMTEKIALTKDHPIVQFPKKKKCWKQSIFFSRSKIKRTQIEVVFNVITYFCTIRSSLICTLSHTIFYYYCGLICIDRFAIFVLVRCFALLFLMKTIK